MKSKKVKANTVFKSNEIRIEKSIIHKLLNTANPKIRAVILVSTSGGLNLDEIVRLRLSDIDFTVNPTKILVRGVPYKRTRSYRTFISEDATISLKEYLKIYFGWHPNSLNLDISHVYVFGKAPTNEEIQRFNPISWKKSLQTSLRNYVKNIQ